MRFISRLGAIALLASVAASRGLAQSQTGHLGTNLNGLSDFSRQWAFVDAFKLSRPWLDASFANFPAAQIDSDGWVTSLNPGQVAQALMFFDGSGHYPSTPNCAASPSAANCYVLKFDGVGTISFGAGAAIVASPGPGNRFFVNVPAQSFGNGGIVLKLTATTPGNAVKNIRFVMAGFEATADAQPFHPLFLQTLAPYKVIRFMDWMGANGSTIQNFSEWKTLASATQTVVDPGFNEHGSGVAFEYMVDLCNTLDADMWITMPAQATDAFVTAAATLVRDRLEPARKVYIEYSNEIWNGQFLQGAFIQSRGVALGLGSGFTARLNFQARRSVQMFDIFEAVFGGGSRLVRVLAGQAANADLVRQVALFDNAFLKTDAIALAPYMDGGGRVGGLANLTSLSNAQVLAQMQTDLTGTTDNDNHVKLWLETHRKLVQGPGLFGSFPDGMVNASGVPLRIVAYEGGQHLLALQTNSGVSAAETLLDSVNRDALMGTLYKQYFCQWRAITGGDSFVHFNDLFSYGRFGRWGALEFQDQAVSTSPKFLALEDYASGGIDCAGNGFPSPPLIMVSDPSVVEGNGGTVNLAFSISLSAPAPGPISVKVSAVAGTATSGTDFSPLTQTVSFALGEMVKLVSVVVNGDSAAENDETVFLNLSNPLGAPIADAHGVGTILNDDGLPPLAINSFSASNVLVNPFGTSTLSWSASSGAVLTLNGAGVPGPTGTMSVSPAITTAFTLTATDGSSSTSRSVTVHVNDGSGGLATPSVTSPGIGQVVSVTGVGFTWTGVGGATGYDLRVLDNTTGTLLFSGSLLGGGSTSTLVTLGAGSYRFAVRACSGGFAPSQCGGFGTTSFTVTPASPSGTPTVTFPAQGANLTASTQALSWTAVAPNPALSGLTYEVLLRDLTAGTTALQITVPSPNLSTIFTMRSSTQYELKIRACQAGCGPFSTPVTFAVTLPAVPTTPPSISSCTVSGGNSLTCNWGAVANADAYQVQVVQAPPAGPGGGALTAAARQVSATTVTMAVPAGAATVFIAACNGNGCGPNATTGITAAGPNSSLPNLGTPMAGTVVNGPGVLFTWNRVPGDNGSNTLYRLFVQDLSRQATALDVFTASNFHSAFFKAEGARYDALVVANPGPAQVVGPSQGFNVAGSSATAPTMVSPAHNSTVPSGNIQLGWSPVPGATLYEYFVAVLGQGTASARGVTPGLLAQVPLTGSGPGTVYSGIVRACPAGATCLLGSDTGWGPFSNTPGGPGVTNFTVVP